MVVQSDMRNENVQSPDENDKRQRLRQRFEVVKKLGQGTYGKVQLAIDKDTKREVAIKTIKKAKIENEQDLVRIRREIQIMASIQHPHIIHIYEVFENSEKIVLVMQYASGGELYEYLGCHRKLPEKEARRLFRQIAAAIYYCHKNKICHRDLKLENILLDDKGNAKIADFGLSNLFDERKKLRTFCGSPLYASPEIVKGTPYCGPEVDCWSLGVLLYTLVYGAMPFDGRNFKRLVKQISEGDYFEPTIKSKASGIIRRLLTVDVTYRATIKDICLDEWVNEGYDHSLFKVANDMANLAPGSISSSHILTSSVSTAKNTNHQNVDKFTTNIPLNKYLTSYEPPTRDNFKTTKYAVANNYTASSPYTKAPLRQTTSAVNEVPCEVKFVMCSLLTAVERLVERQCRSMSKNIKNRNDETVDKQCFKTERNESDNTNQNVANDINETRNQRNQVKDSDNKNLSPISLSSERKNEKKTDATDSSNTHAIITSNETLANENICKTTEQVSKTQNIAADQTQIKQKEVESILPIFDVTSIIPKRPSRKNKTNNKEKLIHNAEDIKQVTNTIETSSVKNDFSKRLVHNHEGETQHSQQHSVMDAKKEKLDSSLSSVSKHRNDVIDFINNILSRHKLSTQIVRHTDTDTKTETVKNDEKLSHDNANIYKLQKSTDESTEKLVPNNQGSNESKIIDEFSTKTSLEPTISTMSASLTNNESLSPKIENHETIRTSEESRLILCNTDDEKGDHQALVSAQTCDKITEPQPMISNFNVNESLKQETLLIKNNKNSNIITDALRGSVPYSKIDSVEQKVEYNAPEQRRSLRDSISDKNNENENGKKQTSAKKNLKNRSYSVDNDKKIGDLERILRRPRKYSLCALLAASFEFDQMASKRTRKDSDASKKAPGKVEIPKPFDPTAEPDLQTLTDKKEIILIPSISVAENKQKMENEIEKVKMSALSMIMRKKSEACARRRMRKYARSYTDVLQRIEDMRGEALDLLENCDQLDTENLNGNIDFLVNRDYKFGEELNLSECHWDVENFDYSQPLVAQGQESYVPIRRCCKKIHFPPKSTQNEEQTIEADNENEYLISYEQSGIKEQKTDSEITEKYNSANSLTRKLLRKKHSSLNSVEDRRKNDSKMKQSDETNADEDEIRSIGQSESIYSSSFDRDSSDNDDDDLDEIFGTKLDARGSEDLWQFLKSVNSDLSNHLRKIKHNKSLCSRSKSQECKTTVNPLTYEKLLTRSRSKEEKQNSQLINGAPESLRDSCYCSLASDFNQAHCNGEHFDRENSSYSISMKNSQSLDGEFGSSEKDMYCNSQLNISESLREKYYSLSNLDDTHSFLYSQNFKQGQDPKKCKSWATVLDLGDTGESMEKGEEISPSDARTQSLYGTVRPRCSSKTRRAQSQVVLNRNDTSQETEHEYLTKSSNTGYRNKEHSILMQNRSSSEFNINSKELTRNSESLHNLNFNAGDKSSLTFSKSLGSKLNLESYNISSDTLNKTTHKAKANELKKRARKVSFLDVSKQKTSNFGLESVAKAQKVLSTIDREVDNKPPDESGTLLQALKTQGYKNLISQRLQELEANEEPLNRRYSWACMRNFANYYPNSLQVGNGDIDLSDYAQYLSWNQQLTGLTDSIGYEEEPYDENLDIFSDPKMLSALYGINNYQKMDNHYRTLPNMWLYQNVNDFRSERNVPENFIAHDFENSVPYSAYNETYNYDLTDLTNRSSTLSPRKSNRIKKKIIVEPEQNSSTSHEAGLQRKTPSTIEKLSMKIKALKNRCTQKSFDDSSDTKDESIEPVKNREFEHNNRVTSSSDAVDSEDPNESVSDRIWRKSFYSRFNDGLTTKQRRSMLMESDFSLDSLLSRPLKQRVNSDVKIDERKPKLRVSDTLSSREKKDINHAEESEGMDGYKTSEVLENDRNIPHSVDSKNAVTDQAEDR